MKQQVVKVELDRAEGPVTECVAVEFVGSACMGQAQHQMSLWSDTAPEAGGYDKVDFTVTFADGETYKGRYDLTRTGLNDAHETIVTQMRNFLRFIAGLNRPAWMNDQQWKQSRLRYEENGSAQEALRFLDTHEF